MGLFLNTEQAKGLANLFFDIAKGLILGGVGFAAFGSLELRIVVAIVSLTSAYICTRIALAILAEVT